jgi:hypothetical protein
MEPGAAAEHAERENEPEDHRDCESMKRQRVGLLAPCGAEGTGAPWI